jgi:tRNA(Arg) A34 adenosine deaminase TadA
MTTQEQHEEFIRRSIMLSKSARDHGNHPFGALLVNDKNEIILEAENTVFSDNDVTRHAELNLVSKANRTLDPEIIKESTLYTSTEPCAMCAGSIFWTGIKRVVYACSEERLGEITRKSGTEEKDGSLNVPCRLIFSRASGRTVQVIGPILEEEAAKVHETYW